MAALESIFQRLTWETRGLKIDGEYLEYLSHHRFADDILICANAPYEQRQMLQEVEDKGDDRKLHNNVQILSYISRDTVPEKKPRQRHSKKNHGRMDSIRQTPRHLQG